MPDATIHAVTGAFGYSGKYIARRLLDEGQSVVALTDWVRLHADTLGRRYTSELARRKDRASAYGSN